MEEVGGGKMRKDDFEFTKYDDPAGIIENGYNFPKKVIGNFLQVLEGVDYAEHYRIYMEDSFDGDTAPYLIADYGNSKSLDDEAMNIISPDQYLSIFYKLLEFPEDELPRSKKGRMLIMLCLDDGGEEERQKIYVEFARRFRSFQDQFYNLVSFRACVGGEEIEF